MAGLMLLRWLVVAAFAATFATFVWGIRRYFRAPENKPLAMRLISIVGLPFGLLHLWGLLTADIMQPWALLTGGVLYIAALILFVSAKRAHAGVAPHAVFSPAAPAQLVTRGPYRFIRHPFYSAYLLAWLAGGVAVWQPIFFAAVIVMTGVYWRAARGEERAFLSGAMGDRYRQYMKTTRMFVPFVL